jgi:hypothetical protein
LIAKVVAGTAQPGDQSNRFRPHANAAP